MSPGTRLRLERNARFDCIERCRDAGPLVGSLQKTSFGQRLDIVMDAPVVPLEGLGERANPDFRTSAKKSANSWARLLKRIGPFGSCDMQMVAFAAPAIMTSCISDTDNYITIFGPSTEAAMLAWIAHRKLI
jgi:hypothetical protein